MGFCLKGKEKRSTTKTAFRVPRVICSSGIFVHVFTKDFKNIALKIYFPIQDGITNLDVLFFLQRDLATGWARAGGSWRGELTALIIILLIAVVVSLFKIKTFDQAD